MAERKGKKLRRCTPMSKARYKLQFGKTDDNRKRNLRKRIRSNPADKGAMDRYERDLGRADTLGLTSKGRKLAKRYAKQAKQREAA